MSAHEPSAVRRARTEKVSSVVARRIVRDVVDRQLVAGDRLPPEGEMLEQFQVSRASLREALRILEVQGLITIKPGPGGGPSVADMDSRDFGRTATLFFQVMRVDMRAVVESRLIIEPVMARLAATRNDATMNDELLAIVEAHRSAADDREWLHITNEFHGLICSMSGNPLLNLLARALKDIYTDRVSTMVFDAAKRAHVIRTHAKIADAIVKGDAATAERLMRTHMQAYAESFADRHPGLMDELVDWR